MGTWTSTASIGAGVNACTNFQWKLTGQQGNAVSGVFSAVCGSLAGSGTVTAQLNGSDIPFQISGSASVPGLSACSFSFSGTAHIEGGDALRVPYSGSTCLGPVQGEEVLRRPSQPAPPATTPAPPPAPAPDPEPPAQSPPAPGNIYHVGPGAPSFERAYQVVMATRGEFPGLIAPRATNGESLAAASELLQRIIWHLHLAGFQAGRQRNPSGAISSDKLTVYVDGAWHAFDLFRNVGTAGEPIDVIFLEVFPANTVADGGIPD
jgi:hypothetical protein